MKILKSDINLSFIFVQAIIVSLFCLIFIKLVYERQYCDYIYLNRILGLSATFKYEIHPIPHIEIFFKAFTLMFIQFFIISGLYYIFGDIFGNRKADFSAVLSSLSVNSLVSSIFFSIALFTIIIFPLFTLFLFTFQTLCLIILNHLSIEKLFLLNRNISIFITPAVYICYFGIHYLFFCFC